MNPNKIDTNSPPTKARLARTVKGLAGRLDHVETLLAAKPLRAALETHGARTDGLAATVGELVVVVAGLQTALAEVADKVNGLAAPAPVAGSHVSTMTPEAAEALAALPGQREAEAKRLKAERDRRYRESKKAKALGVEALPTSVEPIQNGTV